MKSKGNWIVMPLRERIFIVGLVIFVVIFFLPWSYDITFLNLSMMVWGTYFLTFMAPIISIIFLMTDKANKVVEKGPDGSSTNE